MRRKFLFYIAFFIATLNQSAFTQTYTQMVEFADKKIQEGDYYYAIIYYKKAMEIDSNSVEINWKMAEAQRHYKNYVLAEYYYQKVYQKEQAKIYPKSIFWLATMQHYNGKYNESFKSWKLAKKVFKRKRKSYEYKKSLAEFKSTLWARKAINDTTEYIVNPIDASINSTDTELAPFVHQKTLFFTSLKADSVKVTEEIIASEYSLQIYKSSIKDSNTYSKPKKLNDVYQKGYHSANGSFSPDGKRFYFSRCNSDFKCKIYVGKIKGQKITDIDSLGSVINQEGATTTMPHVTLIDGKEIIFFVSDREKSIGGLDIWWSEIKNGNQYTKPRNLGRKINSMDDDITPFYHPIEKRLYFSSSWHPGYGGQDIFYVDKIDGMVSFLNPINVGIPINSPQNDTYYFYDTVSEMAYFSSNRIGSNSVKSPTCCNDIFIAHLPKAPKPKNQFSSLYDLNKKLPVTLYFHNDEPNPRTRDTTTNLTYMQSYEDYIALVPKYKREYSKGLTGDKAEEAKEDIADFFIEYVEQGVLDLKEFTRLLLIELEKGYQIQITVKGFASPLAKTDYNINLTKRRINSLINYLYAYGNGEFKPYLDGNATNGGSLSFIQIPFGEYTANQLISDNPNDTKNSVYSRKAALERKIEIQSVSLVTKDSSYAEMSFDNEVYDFGKSYQGDKLTHKFKLTNTGTDTLIISDIKKECDCIEVEFKNKKLLPSESAIITITINTSLIPKGITAKKVLIYGNIKENQRILTLTTEIF
ncbi:MAG TPA: DUF1573 domain-containing protein [Crocinitomix sp.]|nr:DUF1573 domain-containing protein [Crocinitomix sp.]